MRNIDGKRPGNLGRVVAGACVALAFAGAAHAQLKLDFTNLAGGAPNGDGGPAKAANLLGVTDIVFDSSGNLYLTQPLTNRIRRIAPNGTITTLVGGNMGFAGDGGNVANALINRPTELAIDKSNNLYFADTGNNRVRKITPAGVITTVAGNGIAAHSGDGGQAINAGINDPWGVAVDRNGNLYIAENNEHRIRKVTPTGIISTYAGTGERGNSGDWGAATAATFNSPYGIAVDASGNLYVADYNNGAIRQIFVDGTITTLRAGLTYASNVEADAAGNVYYMNNCLLNKQTPSQTTWWGDNSMNCQRSPDGTQAIHAGFGSPDGIFADTAGNIYFADPTYGRIAKISAADFKIYTHAGVMPSIPDGTPGASAQLSRTGALSVADDGSVLVSEGIPSYRVRRITGGKVYTIGGNGNNVGLCSNDCMHVKDMSLPYQVGISAAPGGAWWITDTSIGGVLRVTPDGTWAMPWSGWPSGVAADLEGWAYVADYDRNRIIRTNANGLWSVVVGTGYVESLPGDNGPALQASVPHPTALTVDGGNTLYFFDGFNAIRKVGRDKVVRRVAGNGESGYYTGEGGKALDARIGYVAGVAAHTSGVYFTSEGRIRRVRPDGRIETIAFPHYALGLAVKYGGLYVSTMGGRVQRATLPRKASNDYNGDMRSDVFWRNNVGGNLLWLSADSTTRQTVPTVPTERKLVGQGDFDGDGKSDLLWHDMLTGNNIVWRAANPNTQMILASAADANWFVAGVGDFNGDGKSDVLWRNSLNGANEYWPSGAASAKKPVNAMVDIRWVVAGIGDFDADGKSDILWRNTETGKNQYWPGALASQTQGVTSVLDIGWMVAAIGDFNGDGASDIVWRSMHNGASAIWRSASSVTRQSIVAVTNMQWQIAAAGDYDNDGIDDLLWRNSVTGENTIWKNAVNAKQRAVSSAGNTWKVEPRAGQL